MFTKKQSLLREQEQSYQSKVRASLIRVNFCKRLFSRR